MVDTAPNPLAQWLASAREALNGVDPLLVVCGSAGLLLLVLMVWAAGRSRGAATVAEFAEIKGRLTAMSEMTGDTVQRLSDRVDTLARHMGDNLAEAGRRTTESLSTLNERLAVIAEARQSLADLSSEVGSLAGVLANKQARGAFGQIRMEAIIRDALPASAYEFQPTLSNGKRPDCIIR
ncbi:MAG: DNA recombination protein RmuC, partial [Hyphomicrobium sp.]